MILPVLLVIASLAFLVLEVFLVSFGTLAIVAAAFGVGAVALAFGQSDLYGWTMLAVLLAAAPLTLWGAFRVLPKIPFARGFYLDKREMGTGERQAAARPLTELLGSVGEAVSPLRPSGIAQFDGRPFDVVTDGVPVERGTRVRVVEVSGNRVIVTPEP
ncbi:MAG: NfeD family protein [Planctomycetaceae bacterium]